MHFIQEDPAVIPLLCFSYGQDLYTKYMLQIDPRITPIILLTYLYAASFITIGL